MNLSLRVRLGLWYGGLTGLVMLLVGLVTYGVHARSEYAALDQTILAAATHVAAEYQAAPSEERREAIITTPVASSVGVRLYDASGGLRLQATNAALAPAFNARELLREPSQAPYDLLSSLIPFAERVSPKQGRFGVLPRTDGQRWRVYVMSLNTGEYLAAIASLEQVDASVDTFRALVPLVVLAGAVIALVSGWLLASRALRPVASLTEIAGDIARSRNFSRRVHADGHQDELGRLAVTFNEMLDGLEESYRTQQRFVADVSHELRAPLTAIQANLELLERQPTMAAPDRALAIDEASREARRLGRMVADMLILARADAGVPIRRQRVDLASVVLDSAAELRQVSKGQRFEIERVDPAAIEGDPDRLKQLVLILLDNAFKYTPPQGRVALALTRQGSVAEVKVTDNGVGIPAGDLPHVFERFYRADPARSRDPGGSGLGLSIARSIARQHGGDISICSQPGKGTTISVRLPATPTSKQSTSRKRRSAAAASVSQRLL
ncbi:MAG: HAMP domain-containing histidine kinase [Chloroflexota bacterium]|nr:HAMP domain-containing histidine kinase [Chloroflexota bacterium]